MALFALSLSVRETRKHTSLFNILSDMERGFKREHNVSPGHWNSKSLAWIVQKLSAIPTHFETLTLSFFKRSALLADQVSKKLVIFFVPFSPVT